MIIGGYDLLNSTHAGLSQGDEFGKSVSQVSSKEATASASQNMPSLRARFSNLFSSSHRQQPKLEKMPLLPVPVRQVSFGPEAASPVAGSSTLTSGTATPATMVNSGTLSRTSTLGNLREFGDELNKFVPPNSKPEADSLNGHVFLSPHSPEARAQYIKSQGGLEALTAALENYLASRG